MSKKLTAFEKKKAFLEFCRREFHRTRGEEWANGITHIVGVVFGIVALTMMMVFCSLNGNAWHVVSCSIYGSTLIILSVMSSLYHLLTNFRAKRIFQIFDHCMIYFLIAGTYTPYALVTMGHSKMGWIIMGIEWGLAIVGVLVETLLPKWVDYVTLPIYLVMGWLILIDYKTVLVNLPIPGLVMLLVGGVTYTLGVVFYIMDRVPYMHTIWHVFVLGGMVCHWVSIMFFVIP